MITELYTAWVEAEALAQTGECKPAEAKAARQAYASAARELVSSFPYKTRIVVRSDATPRVDAAEHVVAAEDIRIKGAAGARGFTRNDGEAICARRLNETNSVTVKRKAPSCACCLVVVERLNLAATPKAGTVAALPEYASSSRG